MKVKFIHVLPETEPTIWNLYRGTREYYGLFNSKEKPFLDPSEYGRKIIESIKQIVNSSIEEAQKEKELFDSGEQILMVATPEFFYYLPRSLLISEEQFLQEIIPQLKEFFANKPEWLYFHFGSLCVQAKTIKYLEVEPKTFLRQEPNVFGQTIPCERSLSYEENEGQPFFNLAIYGQGKGETSYYSKTEPFREDPYIVDKLDGGHAVMRPVFIEGQNSVFISRISGIKDLGQQFIICFDYQSESVATKQLSTLIALNKELPMLGFTHCVGQGAVINIENSFYTLVALADTDSEQIKDVEKRKNIYVERKMPIIPMSWPISANLYVYPAIPIGTLRKEIKEQFEKIKQAHSEEVKYKEHVTSMPVLAEQYTQLVAMLPQEQQVSESSQRPNKGIIVPDILRPKSSNITSAKKPR